MLSSRPAEADSPAARLGIAIAGPPPAFAEPPRVRRLASAPERSTLTAQRFEEVLAGGLNGLEPRLTSASGFKAEESMVYASAQNASSSSTMRSATRVASTTYSPRSSAERTASTRAWLMAGV